MELLPESLHNSYILVRHGQSVANKLGIIVSNPDVGVIDYGLTAEGKEQALRAAADVKRLVANLADVVIVTSDFKRAFETAVLIRKDLEAKKSIGVTVTASKKLRERFFGEFDMGTNANYEIVWKEDEKNSGHSMRGVESVESVLRRGIDLVTELERKWNKKSILLVGHGDTLQILQTAFLKQNSRDHRSLPHLNTCEVRQVYVRE